MFSIKYWCRHHHPHHVFTSLLARLILNHPTSPTPPTRWRYLRIYIHRTMSIYRRHRPRATCICDVYLNSCLHQCAKSHLLYSSARVYQCISFFMYSLHPNVCANLHHTYKLHAWNYIRNKTFETPILVCAPHPHQPWDEDASRIHLFTREYIRLFRISVIRLTATMNVYFWNLGKYIYR